MSADFHFPSSSTSTDPTATPPSSTPQHAKRHVVSSSIAHHVQHPLTWSLLGFHPILDALHLVRTFAGFVRHPAVDVDWLKASIKVALIMCVSSLIAVIPQLTVTDVFPNALWATVSRSTTPPDPRCVPPSALLSPPSPCSSLSAVHCGCVGGGLGGRPLAARHPSFVGYIRRRCDWLLHPVGRRLQLPVRHPPPLCVERAHPVRAELARLLVPRHPGTAHSHRRRCATAPPLPSPACTTVSAAARLTSCPLLLRCSSVLGYQVTLVPESLTPERFAFARIEEICIGVIEALLISSLLWPVSSIRLLRSEIMLSVASFRMALDKSMKSVSSDMPSTNSSPLLLTHRPPCAVRCV